MRVIDDPKEQQELIQQHRAWMKCDMDEVDVVSDQMKRLPQPPLTKAPGEGKKISLTRDFSHVIKEQDIVKVIAGRQSHRFFKEDAMTLDQLSFLLWACQGVKGIRGKSYATLRTVPSGGARHAYECYLAVDHVEGLERGIYHYLPMEHQLELVSPVEQMQQAIDHISGGQKWICKAAVTFAFTAVPYRAEWRYSFEAHRVMLMDVGHIVENLYLACEAIGCGTCGVGAFLQKDLDKLLGVDGEEEFAVYIAPVGKKDEERNAALNKKLYAFVDEK